jgi:hypothetical protein
MHISSRVFKTCDGAAPHISWCLLYCGFILSSCSWGNTHQFLVSGNEGPLRVSATVCEQTTDGAVSGNLAQGAFTVPCSGALTVKVVYSDYEVTCTVGYLDVAQEPRKWLFEVANRQCKFVGRDKL